MPIVNISIQFLLTGEHLSNNGPDKSELCSRLGIVRKQVCYIFLGSSTLSLEQENLYFSVSMYK